MKKEYKAPQIYFEEYKLNTSITSNCKTVVTNGPAHGTQPECEDYRKIIGDDVDFPDNGGISTYAIYNVAFWPDDEGGTSSCDCYTSAGDRGFWMS